MIAVGFGDLDRPGFAVALGDRTIQGNLGLGRLDSTADGKGCLVEFGIGLGDENHQVGRPGLDNR